MATEEFKDGAEVNQDDTAAMQKVGGWNPALKLKAVSTPLSSCKKRQIAGIIWIQNFPSFRCSWLSKLYWVLPTPMILLMRTVVTSGMTGPRAQIDSSPPIQSHPKSTLRPLKSGNRCMLWAKKMMMAMTMTTMMRTKFEKFATAGWEIRLSTTACLLTRSQRALFLSASFSLRKSRRWREALQSLLSLISLFALKGWGCDWYSSMLTKF